MQWSVFFQAQVLYAHMLAHALAWHQYVREILGENIKKSSKCPIFIIRLHCCASPYLGLGFEEWYVIPAGVPTDNNLTLLISAMASNVAQVGYEVVWDTMSCCYCYAGEQKQWTFSLCIMWMSNVFFMTISNVYVLTWTFFLEFFVLCWYFPAGDFSTSNPTCIFELVLECSFGVHQTSGNRSNEIRNLKNRSGIRMTHSFTELSQCGCDLSSVSFMFIL